MNLADISMFESLQSDQHNRTNMNQMSVFNDLNKLNRTMEELRKFNSQVMQAQEILKYSKSGDKSKQQADYDDKYKTWWAARDRFEREANKESQRISAIQDSQVKRKEIGEFEDIVTIAEKDGGIGNIYAVKIQKPK
jgi:hypothetical protein